MTEPRRPTTLPPHTARVRRLALFWILNAVLAAGILVFALR
ncbi:hypothetical protein [Stappia sp. WLB 29]|nr:hypothetical protein [Stappia sp. WLB 29]